MSKVEESVVREYFEAHRFLVKRLPKGTDAAHKKKTADGEVHLLVFNPMFRRGSRKPGFLLFASELPYVHQAVVTLSAGPGPSFGPAVLRSGAKLLRFLEKHGGKGTAISLPAVERLGEMEKAPLRILVLPALPTVEPYRQQSIELLRSRGVDGIISFRSMLVEMVARVEANGNYEDSEILELIRVLKNYDMISDPQMELFGGERG